VLQARSTHSLEQRPHKKIVREKKITKLTLVLIYKKEKG
jgi:hypothetical protein